MALDFDLSKPGIWRTMPNGEKIYIYSGQSVGESINAAAKRGAKLFGDKSVDKAKEAKEPKETDQQRWEKEGRQKYEKQQKNIDKMREEATTDKEREHADKIQAILDENVEYYIEQKEAAKEKELESDKKAELGLHLYQGMNTPVIERGLFEPSPSFIDIPEEVQTRVIETLNTLQAQTPDVMNDAINMGLEALDDGVGAYFNPVKEVFRYSEELFTDPTKVEDYVQRNVKSGYMTPAPEGKGVEYIVTHEYGHHLQNQLAKNLYQKSSWDSSQGDVLRNYAGQYLAEFRAKYGDIPEDQVSGYAGTASWEWFAESYADTVFNPDRNQHTTNFKEFLDIKVKEANKVARKVNNTRTKVKLADDTFNWRNGYYDGKPIKNWDFGKSIHHNYPDYNPRVSYEENFTNWEKWYKKNNK